MFGGGFLLDQKKTLRIRSRRRRDLLLILQSVLSVFDLTDLC